MSKDNVGGAAFPTPHDPMYLGMSLRDYFAAKAMQAFIADGAAPEVSKQTISLMAYAMADAMLEAREA